MAEALAVVGVVASIIQLVNFSTRVVARLDQLYSDSKEVPKAFRGVRTELPLLSNILEQLKEAIDSTSIADGSKKALVTVVTGCNEQVAQLDAILEKTLPETNDSWRTKGKKAMVSLHHDAKVENITRTLRNYIGILTFYYAAASSTLQPLTDTKLCKIYQWLSAPDPSVNYQKALKLREADTGLWLLKDDTYNRWKRAFTSPIWLYGIPGCGKTILSSTVLQNVLQYCEDDPGKITAYFFFDFNDIEKQDPEMMVRSLLCQLSQQSKKFPASLDALFSSSENGQRQPSARALLDALRSMIQEFPQVYIVLDALDECAQRQNLLETLQSMAAWQLQNLHLLVTSQKERDIERTLERFVDSGNRICLESALVDKDIQRYIKQRLSTDESLRKWKKDDAVKQEIESTLSKGAHGMFRWAVCQLDVLGKSRNRVMLRRALATLPPTLDQTYDRILSAISEEDSKYALRILQWLTFSARPLSIDEVAEVVAIDTKRDPVFDRDEVLEDPLEVLDICPSLITMAVDKNDRRGESSRQVVMLAHYSVKEYLVSDRIWMGKAAKYGMRDDISHNSIATGCLGYLLQFQQPDLHPDFLQSFNLTRYSAEFWASHVQKGGILTEETTQKVLCLCSKENFAYVNWIRLWNPDKPWMEPNFRKEPKEIANPLYYAALMDLKNVVKILLDKGDNIHAQSGCHSTALQAASYRGHEAMVEMLLSQGADSNAQGGCYSNALQAASFGGHEAIVKTLLNNGADPNAQGGSYGNALQAASFIGQETIVKMLLDNGAEPNAQGGHFGNALQAASSGGHEAVVKALLDAGADPNMQSRYHGNAIQVASEGGYEAVVKVLLDKGADPNAQSGHYGNALQAASFIGQETIVKTLLDNGAEPNAQGGHFGNALQAASSGGYEAVVKVLLDNGAEPNAQGGHFGNALQAASSGGHGAVVTVLLDAGADSNAQGGYFVSALQAALSGGHEAIVKALLEKNTEANE